MTEKVLSPLLVTNQLLDGFIEALGASALEGLGMDGFRSILKEALQQQIEVDAQIVDAHKMHGVECYGYQCRRVIARLIRAQTHDLSSEK